MRAVVFLLTTVSVASHAGTIYLCKSYAGGAFWSSGHCQQHKALIERIVPVPDGIPFSQQVALGEQARAEGARLAAPPQSYAVPAGQQPQQAQQGNKSACQSVDDQIRANDARARQLQSAAEQDRLAREKRALISARMNLNCR